MRYIKTYEKIVYDKSVEDEEGIEVKELTKHQKNVLNKFPFKLGQYVLYESDFREKIYAKIIAINTTSLPTYKLKLINNFGTDYDRTPITWASKHSLKELTPQQLEEIEDVLTANKYNL
jgi:hypothetical protein